MCYVVVPNLLLKIHENELQLIDNYASKAGSLYAKLSDVSSVPNAPLRGCL